MSYDAWIQLTAWIIVISGLVHAILVPVALIVLLMTPSDRYDGSKLGWVLKVMFLPIIGPFMLILHIGGNNKRAKSQKESAPSLYSGPSEDTLRELFPHK